MKSEDGRFAKGAFTLMAAGIAVKLVGALYRIPLYSILGSEGIGLYQMGYPIYAVMFAVTSSGVNVAVSKVIAERLAKGDEAGAQGAFKVSLFSLALLGALGSILLHKAAPLIASTLGRDPRAALSISAISPSLFLASVLSAFRGWFQGIQEMSAPAASQVIEALGRLGAMLVLARALMAEGIERAAAGAAFGAAIGAGFGLSYILWVYLRARSRLKHSSWSTTTPSSWDTARAIARTAVPISLASAVFGITEIIDLGLVPRRLQVAGLSVQEATREFGRLAAGAMPLVNLPTVFTVGLGMAIVPSISDALARGDGAAVRRRASKAFSLTLALGLPASLGVAVLSRQIPAMLYGDQGIGSALLASAPAVLFLAFQQVSAGVLQGLGKVKAPLENLLWAALAKAIATYVLVPPLGIVGAGIATSLHFGVAALLNLRVAKRHLGALVPPGDVFRTSLASAAMAVCVGLGYRWLWSALGEKAATLAAVGTGVLSYGLFGIILGVFGAEDLAGTSLGRFFRGRS